VSKRNSVWRNIDWLTVIIYLVMIFLGWVNIYASVFDEEYQSIFDISSRHGKQLVWIAAALLIAFIILLIERDFYVFSPYVIYGLIILLLILVLFTGTEINNSMSWITIGNFGFQPSEFGKFATGLALAKYMSSYNFKLRRFKSFAVFAVIILLPVSLIFLQNDAGSAIVYFSFILVLYREGLSSVFLFFGFLTVLLFILSLIMSGIALFIMLSGIALLTFLVFNPGMKDFFRVTLIFIISLFLPLAFNYSTNKGFVMEKLLFAGLILAGGAIFIYSMRKKLNKYALIALILVGSVVFSLFVDYAFNNLLEPYHRVRINELMGISSDPLGAGYNVNQSKIAIGSGGLWGKGFLNGTQTKFNFVPEQSTDFIFCTVGEEWGFAGTLVVIILFIMFFIRLIRLAERQRSSFSRIYGYSVVSILFFHFMINIGMTIGIMPVIGIPLPFFSYGGSSLWSFTILLFIFLRLDAARLDQIYG
jgi:rod shape determining protein RodA